MDATDRLIERLPKAELHLHIEGTLEPQMALDMARRNGVELGYASADELAARYEFQDLQSFLDLYYQATAVLLTERDFYDLTWAYLQRCRADNVVHTEIFFDPQSHTSRNVPFATVIGGIRAALRQAETELGITSRLIMCYLRHLPADEALAVWELAQPHLDMLDGVGLDSSERDFPPRLFADVFARARAAGLETVAHAGEEGPPAYIREALELLHVARIDHGVRIVEDPALLLEVARRQVPLTVCPLSNVRLRVYETMAEHPVLELLEQGLCVTVNSDDPAYFGGYVNDNYRAVSTALGATQEQIVRLAKNSFHASFLDAADRQRWMSSIEQVVSAGQ